MFLERSASMLQRPVRVPADPMLDARPAHTDVHGRAECMTTSLKLNELMRANSKDAHLVFCNLPAPTARQTPLDCALV